MNLLVAVLLITTIFSVDAKLKSGQIENDCLKEVGIERQVYDDAMKNKLKNADMKIKCMTKCLVKSYEIMKSDGTIDVEKTATVAFSSGSNNDYDMNLLEECIQTKENECETAYHLVTCVNKKFKGDDKEEK